ncbi:hypothetical protein DD238_001336 [Peronospora effusa]|uniref:Vta1/callose synthase N-terminal domain-containing protein n=1 Tax=Peronospora effusa TaxID=542832 RepID=A0A3M6VR41_9STRA|nr:hypothetical protein DD238_001336 [Peronospora effusa]RQM09205.1 hypothetical protein DD237_000337 [Peronospora effusa]
MTDPQPVKVPPTFKTLLPFIRRAEELDRDTSRPESKLIAYFCRQYAMELGIKLRENDTSNEATDYLLSLMDRLEGEKEKLPEFTQEEGKEICEDFAMEIFSKADDEDRTGIATKSTARTFYAAGTFFDILHQFGDISEDVSKWSGTVVQEKRRYCKYKAATILKAIKDGKVPTPGSPEEMDIRNTDNASDDAAPTTTAMNSVPQAAALAMPRFDSPPPRPVEQSSFLSRTESANSAGAMSASELDSICHRPSSTQPPTLPLAPSHSVPAPMYSAPTAPAPASAYQPPATPTPSPPPAQLAPLPSFRPPSAPTPSNQPAPSYTPQKTSVHARATPVSQSEINDAIEFAKFAVAALKVKDMKLAEERLEMALRNIRGA